MAPPIIRDVGLETARSGTVTNLQEAWVTCWTGRHADPCTVVADYGPTIAYGSTSPPMSPAASHRVPLGDLTPGAYYHFRLTATSSPGGEVTVGQDQTFTNTPGPVPPGPTLSAIAAGTITATGATITWTTAPACPPGQVNYGPTPALGSSASESAGADRTAHSRALTGLTPATRYYYRVFQVAPDGNSTYSGLRSFLTPAA